MPKKQSSCSDSALEVYNGQYGLGHGARLGLFCNTIASHMIYSSGRYLSIRWRAVNGKAAANFEVAFKSVEQSKWSHYRNNDFLIPTWTATLSCSKATLSTSNNFMEKMFKKCYPTKFRLSLQSMRFCSHELTKPQYWRLSQTNSLLTVLSHSVILV